MMFKYKGRTYQFVLFRSLDKYRITDAAGNEVGWVSTGVPWDKALKHLLEQGDEK